MYYSIVKKPKDGQLVLCRCPYWCELGYQVAKYKDGIFHYDEQPNDRFHENVTAWMPLPEE